MPLKKRARVVNPQAEPGVVRKYLIENFSTLPSTSGDLKNGHVLQLYVCAARSSGTETERQLKARFSSEGSSFCNSLAADIKRIVRNSLEKFQRLTNPQEFAKFTAICEEQFQLLQQAVDPEVTAPVAQLPAPEDPDDVSPSTSKETLALSHSATMTSTPVSHREVHSEPGSSGSSRGHRGDPLTPRKAKMKRRLEFMSSRYRTLRERYVGKVVALKGQLRTPRRVINQAIRRQRERAERKNKEIKKLKDMLQENALYNELQKERRRNRKLKDTHRKLRQRSQSPGKVSSEMYEEVVRKLKEKDTLIAELQHKNLLLEEKLEELSSATDLSHATVGFLSARMRACKNKTMDYLDRMDEQRREHVLGKVRFLSSNLLSHSR
ncbi:uncharacterized protein LOC114910197 [Scleropages formosus]|uniref:uncharacterized protein LOC114910197 n=1 Tax=Scleropages formosus TaxID=113540 RepID=UPI0010FA7B5D|nr:uncharacterized protein LOC114910197 [Scleropages formosus]XP_029106166.1 uncharacterized protein LOC114910197 [Scleropages formosus]